MAETNTPKLLPVEPLLVGPAVAARLLGMSVSTFYQLCSSGVIGPVGSKLGKKRLFSVQELRSWVLQGCKPRRVWLQLLEAEGKR